MNQKTSQETIRHNPWAILWTALCLWVLPVMPANAQSPYMYPITSPYIQPFAPFYAGIDYILTGVKPKGEWNNIFVTTDPGPGLFFGWRWCGPFALNYGLEFGYDWSVEKGRSVVIPNGATFLGVRNTSGVAVTATGKVRFKSGYMDAKVYIPVLLDPCMQCFFPEFVLAVGVASSKAAMTVRAVPNGTPTGPNPLTPQLNNIIGATQSTVRAGLGFQGMVWGCLGLRAMAHWENYSRLRAGRSQGLETSPGNRKIFNDGVSLSLGAYITFQAF